jgi:hypothetical protein
MEARDSVGGFLHMLGDPRDAYPSPHEAADALIGRLRVDGFTIIRTGGHACPLCGGSGLDERDQHHV